RVSRMRLTLALIAAAGLVAASPAQQIFRTDVRGVPVYITASDARGPVTDLRVDDFEIADNGRKQPITAFATGPQPIAVSILLDNSPSVLGAADRAEMAVTTFARSLAADDRACLGTFSHVVTLSPELTSSPDVLLKHLGDDAPFPAGTALWDAIDAGRAAL